MQTRGRSNRGKARARQACQSCNARRVKCDLVENNPCTNCAVTETPCVPRESRRGKHPRKPRRSDQPPPQRPLLPQHETPELLVAQPIEPVPLLSSESSAVPRVVPGVPHAASSVTANRAVVVWDEHDHDHDHITASQVLAGLSQNDTAGPGWPQFATPDGTHSGSSSSQPQPYPAAAPLPNACVQDDEAAVFLGESTSIRYLHNNTDPSPASVNSPPKHLSMYPVPEGVSARNLTSEWEAEREQSKVIRLEAEGALSFPPRPAIETLLRSYFRWFHSCFAIVDEPDIWRQHRGGLISPLLLQSLLFVGIMHCHEDDLPSVGLGSRNRAKFILYNRAKDLYDAEIEPRAFVVTQALFLMGFWRAGALLQKDTRHWLAAAINLAQTKALHRASSQAAGSSSQRRLRKRLWWAIYIRERQCAAALGLPNRVRDEDCDVEALDETDFENAFSPETPLADAHVFAAYMIGMAELALMLGRIIHCDFLPSKRLSCQDRQEMKEVLVAWNSRLPTCMQPASDGLDNVLGYHASMLHLASNNLLILLYRSSFGSSSDQNNGVDGQVALQAAARNTAIVENMVALGSLRHAQIHVITNIFNTLCIHTLALRQSQGNMRYLAEHRAKLCLLGLRELQKTWEVKNWILQLFFQYLDQSTAARLQFSEESGEPETTRQVPDNRGLATNTENFATDPAQAMAPATLGNDTPWLRSIEDVGEFLYSQIENRFVNSEGGAIDWYMADLFDTPMPVPLTTE